MKMASRANKTEVFLSKQPQPQEDFALAQAVFTSYAFVLTKVTLFAFILCDFFISIS